MYKETPRESTINTVECMLNILEAMKKHKTKKLVHASTSAVYEGQPVPYHEDMILVPPDLKALSKKFNEEMAQLYSTTYGITAIHMRPFSVYGEGEIWKKGYANVISLFAWAMVSGKNPVVWGDGTQTRDFIHAEDAARVFKLALESDMPSQPLNVGTGIEISFNEVISQINKILGTDLKPVYVDVPIDIYALRLWSNNERLEKTLGFKPEISVQQGIERVVKFAQKYIAEHPERANDQMYFETLPER
jgi:UDP-glucose 4-epimerase